MGGMEKSTGLAPKAIGNNWRTLGILGAWCVCIHFGLAGIARYQVTPGRSASLPDPWPTAVALSLTADHSLIVFAHPRCPCTRATLSEIERIMPMVGSQLAVHIFFRTETENPGESQTPTWSAARRIPNVVIHRDRKGDLARQFGARTSGQVGLYNSEGRLLFQGGITAGRGHAGGNAGTQAILKCIRSGSSTLSSFPVFGCPIFEEEGVQK